MRPFTRLQLGSTVLVLAAVGMLCMAAVQAIMPLSRPLVRAFDGPEDWSTPMLFASSVAVAAILVGIALYPLSGAGCIRRLPLLRTVLLIAGLGFTYRGLGLPGQIAGALGYGPMADSVHWGHVVSSAGTLAVGVCCLLGLALSWRVLGREAHLRRAPGSRVRA